MRWLCGLVLVAALGCTNKLGGDVVVNDEKLELDSCHSGVAYGFRGVEVVAKSGVRVRVGATPTGEAHVFVMLAGAEVGKDLGACGSFQISDQNSTVNDVKNVEGKATFDCAAEGITAKGSFTFENCH